MKFSCIFMITFWCTLYISEKTTGEIDENFVNQPIVQPAVIIEKSSGPDMKKLISTDDPSGIVGTSPLSLSESDISNMMQREDITKLISSDDPSGIVGTPPSSLSESDISDMMQRKGKKSKFSRNCLDLKKQGKGSGTYMIMPCDDTPSKLVKVYCDMDTDGGGWTVIQHRDNYAQQQDFFGTWAEYAVGFGDPSKDFWLGNDNIHCLTEQSQNEIRFDLQDWSDSTRYAQYRFFYIGDRISSYKLTVQNYTGTAGDAFAYYHNNMTFSTYDFGTAISCANHWKGAWWYRNCHYSHLNGLYNGSSASGVVWYQWKGWGYSLKKTEMKIRPKYY